MLVCEGPLTMLTRLRRNWRERWRGTWRDVRPVVFVLTGVAVIVLGTIGYLASNPKFHLLDALYRTPGLFGTGASVEPPVPWTLEVARWLGPLLFGIAAVKLLLGLFRQEARLLGIRLFARDHVVIAGLGEMGFRMACALHDRGDHVIVIDLDPGNPRATGLRERGVAVLDGDATDPEVLHRARAGRAAHLLALCGDDSVNVDVAIAGQELAERRARGVLLALAHVDDRRLWRALSSAGVGTDSPTFRLDYFNVWAIGAQALLDRHPPLASERQPHVLVAGLDGAGEYLVLRLAALWRDSRPDPGTRMRITLTGPRAAAHVAELERAHPELSNLCELVSHPELDGIVDATCSYVCVADESDGVGVALGLRFAGAAGHVVVTVADGDSGVARALRAENKVLDRIEPFGLLSGALTPDLLGNVQTELLARAKHDEYRRAERRRGVAPGANPSDVPWDALDPALRESNRRFADGISATLAASGCVLVPDPLADPAAPGFRFTDEEVEVLAIQEHDRWMRDLLRDGWRYANGPKDGARRLHPQLVPWDGLTEDDRDRDRDPVREIPAMLAGAGFRVVRRAATPAPPRPVEA